MRIQKIISLIAVGLILIACNKNSETPVSEIKIGALIPLSGNLQSYGPSVLKALQLAETDVNLELESKGKKIRLIYDDNETSANTSRVLLNSYINQGIRVIIGPMSSENLAFVKDTIDRSGSVIISQASTSVELAAENDNIFRLVPNDMQMGKAIINKMAKDGVEKIFTINRSGNWGSPLTEIIQSEANLKGVELLGKTDYYSFRYSEYMECLDEISQAVSDEIAKGGDPSKIGVILISYDEGIDILNLANDYQELKLVKWIGSDGMTLSNALLNNIGAINFARMVNFSSPAFNGCNSEQCLNFSQRLKDELGYEPSIFAILSYDALYAGALTLASLDNDVSVDILRTAIFDGLNNHEGVSGIIELNEAGDRDNSEFIFFGLNESGSPQWVKIGS